MIKLLKMMIRNKKIRVIKKEISEKNLFFYNSKYAIIHIFSKNFTFQNLGIMILKAPKISILW
ncbi:hypothetical protein ABH963_005961 [Bacillus sp. RC55]